MCETFSPGWGIVCGGGGVGALGGVVGRWLCVFDAAVRAEAWRASHLTPTEDGELGRVGSVSAGGVLWVRRPRPAAPRAPRLLHSSPADGYAGGDAVLEEAFMDERDVL
jgi:hypothetical protein